MKKQAKHEKEQLRQKSHFTKPKASPSKTDKRGRNKSEESDKGGSRILSASPNTKLDKIAMAQLRMLQKQKGVIEEEDTTQQQASPADNHIDKELDENYIPENFLATQKLVIPDNIRNDPKKYY